MKSAAALDRAAAEGRAAFVGFLPAGYPEVETAVAAYKTLADNGADIIEIGLPYSDPSMDGPLIQQASSQALAQGLRITDVMRTVEQVASHAPDVAVVVMTYWNPVLRYGVERFAADLSSAGGAGLITPDITPEYGQQWISAADAHDLDKIFLVAQSSTPQRLALTVGASRGFIYAASLMGVTGERTSIDSSARELVARTREASSQHGGEHRVCVGIGVTTPDHAREVAGYADGVIVGSALLRALQSGGTAGLAATTAALVEGVRSPR